MKVYQDSSSVYGLINYIFFLKQKLQISTWSLGSVSPIFISLCVITAASPQLCGWLGCVDNTLIVFNLILIPIKTLFENGGVVLLLQKPLLSSQCKMDSKVLRNCSADTACFGSMGSWWEWERKSRFFLDMTSWLI